MERLIMAVKIDGKALALKHEKSLKERLDKFKNIRLPRIVSFCNTDDPPSVMYTELKQKKAAAVGIDFRAEDYAMNTPRVDIVNKVMGYNLDRKVDGIMVQLPLPEEMVVFQDELLNIIDSGKDVDGLTEEGRRLYLPATTKGVLSILDEKIPDWWNREIIIVGSRGEVGRPLVDAMRNRGIGVIEIDSKIRGTSVETDLKKTTQAIIISATGVKKIIKPWMIPFGVDLIDVGLGEFANGCFEKARFYTGETGGVGPMTVISLMENVVEAYEKRMVK